ncbi:MAG: hypothetical protein JST21_07700 [Bacteroidetes bacterium]|nr:hypothetical protein [Bacteroidota bacterium]
MKKSYCFLYFFCITITAFTQAGKHDLSFNDSGKVITDVHGHAYFNTAMMLPDGKILCAGAQRPLDPYAIFVNALARYTTDGHLDATFGKGGIVNFLLGNTDAFINSIATQDDGKIIATGYTGKHGYDTSINMRITVMRFLSNGKIDSSFANNGVFLFGLDHYDIWGNAIVILSNDKIVVTGSVQSYGLSESKWGAFVLRLTANGKPDASFGTHGYVITRPAKYCDARALALQPDGKIVIAGYALDEINEPVQFALSRFTSSGQPDFSFGKKGVAKTMFEIESVDQPRSMAIQKDGKIIVGGRGYGNGKYADFALVRFDVNGIIDSAFGDNGLSLIDFGYDDAIHSIALQPDGKIVAAGEVNDFAITGKSSFGIARYDSDGKPDSSFGKDAKVVTTFYKRTYSAANKVLLQVDGKIVAIGYASKMVGQNSAFALTRYLGDEFQFSENKKSIDKQNLIKIFPNPVRDRLFIKGLPANQNILKITDRYGNIMKSVIVNGESFQWNIDELMPGAYYLNVLDDKRVYTLLFLKL